MRVTESRSAMSETAPHATLFRYESPVSAATMARWQRELDSVIVPADRRTRILIRWEPGDVWEPVQRFVLWIAQDPKHLKTEPWILNELVSNGLPPAPPRIEGHWCAPGYCLCDVKRNRWSDVRPQFQKKYVDLQTWRLYQDTGLYGWRWWTIQGHRGGHRFLWDREELASKLSVMRGGPADTPAAGDLPYAPFDRRVLHAIVKERRAKDIMLALEDASKRKDALTREERTVAEGGMKALWDWSGDQAEALWHEGAELLPRFFESEYGRMPTGTKDAMNYEGVERTCLVPD